MQSTNLNSYSLSQLLKNVKYQKISGATEVRIRKIVCDSQVVESGSLFVAIPGIKVDGHAYITDAIQKGAVAIVGERENIGAHPNIAYIHVENSRKALAELACAYYDFPTKDLFTVGVTGTNGKTSITFLTQSVLGSEETAVSNTVVNALQHGIDYTTPGALDLQRFAFEALRQKKDNFVIEVSAHALSQDRVHGINFDVGIFTNLTQDHFDYYENFPTYLQAKLKLFQMLRANSIAIINGDDPYAEIVSQKTPAQIWKYGLNPKFDLWADQIRLAAESTTFVAHTPVGSVEISSALPGEFYVYNILAAIAAGLTKNISLQEIKAGIERVHHIEGRFERYKTNNNIAIVIDFAHSPDSLEKMIHTLKKFYPRVTTVFGCGGESDPYKRPIMGEVSGKFSDYTIITNDNPKHEDPSHIIRQIESGILRTKKPYEAISNRSQAILRAVALAQPGECVLIAGKGHERTQIFDRKEILFNDREFLREQKII